MREQLLEGKFWRGKGCSACRGLGYRGRIGLHEVLEVNHAIRSAIWTNVPSGGLIQIAKESGFHSLREDGATKVMEGITTTEELLRATN